MSYRRNWTLGHKPRQLSLLHDCIVKTGDDVDFHDLYDWPMESIDLELDKTL